MFFGGEGREEGVSGSRMTLVRLRIWLAAELLFFLFFYE